MGVRTDLLLRARLQPAKQGVISIRGIISFAFFFPNLGQISSYDIAKRIVLIGDVEAVYPMCCLKTGWMVVVHAGIDSKR